MARDRPLCVNGELIGTHGEDIEWAYPRPHVSPNHQTGGQMSAFQIAAKRLEIDENVNRARLTRHLLAMK